MGLDDRAEAGNQPKAPKPAKPPTPGPEHEKLRIFLGRWHAEGTSYGPGPDGRPVTTPWTSEETVELLEGGFFLLHRWSAVSGGGPFVGVGIIGYDAEHEEFFTRSFENHGYERRYTMTCKDRVWTFDGPTERARVEFSPDGRTQTLNWEWKPEGQGWTKLCDRTARRVD